ncbi:MAG: hypothetical protein CBD16_01310 [Betaproteobacteria bacterium TMED156]|nr:MAG: hypothetical protein CBD16_01310 [Betaproteobacteria bacterium TMED156]
MVKNALDSLKIVTKIVVDSSDFKSIGRFQSQDATTNPSLIIKSAKDDNYKDFITIVSKKFNSLPPNDRAREIIVSFAQEILRVIPGRVSIEVDASLAFNTEQTELAGKKIIESCAYRGIPLERILIKIPATWEGVVAASKLQKQGINCNLTLLFSEVQAFACADAGATLISPFVGRISDWWKSKGKKWNIVDDDPGVEFVRSVFCKFKRKKYKTEVMGASFRSIEQIFSLSGLDLLTISPNFLGLLEELPPQKNLGSWIKNCYSEKFNFNVETDSNNFSKDIFLNLLTQNEMANEKLKEGIFTFDKDGKTLLDIA